MIILIKRYKKLLENLKCISCGKIATIETFCDDCWLKTKSLFQIEDFEIKACRKCNAILYKTSWKKNSKNEELIKKIALSKIKTNNKIIEKDAFIRKIGNRYFLTIICKGFIHPCKKQKEESRNIFVKIIETLCDRCRKISGGQYDAVVQIRTNKYVPIRQMKPDKIERVKEGLNLYFLNKKDSQKALKLLKGFKIKRSFKLIGEKDTKRIYREYYSVKDYEPRETRSRRKSKSS